MTDPALRELTASEPLSIEQEHVMQQKWYLDDDSEHLACACTTLDIGLSYGRTFLPFIYRMHIHSAGKTEVRSRIDFGRRYTVYLYVLSLH